MPNEEFDTMNLIAGASSSELYSLEDILQEYGAEPQPPAEEPNAPQALPDVMLPEEEETPPEYEARSEAEMAEVIAQALADSLEPSEPPEEPIPEPEPIPERDSEPEPENREPPPAAKPKARRQEDIAPSPAPETEREPVPPPAQPAQPLQVESVQPEEPPARQEHRAAAPANTARRRKIPRGRTHDSVAKSLAESFGALRARQRQDLPPNSASLKAAEKHYAGATRIDGLLAPVRYIILVLLALALAGRKYSWMLLGFLGGATGVYAAIWLTLLAMAASWRGVLRAVTDAIYVRMSYETLLLLATLVSLLDTLMTRSETTLLPLLAMGWCFVGTAELLTGRAKLRSLRSVITGRTRTGVRVAPGKWEGLDCIGKTSASTSGFVRRQEEPDIWHSVWRVYGPILFLAAVIVSAYLTAKQSGNYLTILATLLTVSVPVSAALCCARPYELLAHVLGARGAVSGWRGMRGLSGKKALLIYDKDLFPKGTIVHKGVRVLGGQSPQLLVSYGASLVLRADNGLTEPFTRLLRETGGQIFHVSQFQAVEGGLLGRIHNVEVAVGTYNFMLLIGAIPPKNSAKSSVYIALDRQIAGLFAIKHRVRSGAAADFDRLTGDRRLVLLAATKNFCVNPSFVEQWFQVPVGRLTCPKAERRSALSQPSLLVKGSTCGFVMTEGVHAYSRLVAGARRCCRTGWLFTLASVLLSAGMLVHSVRQLSAGGELWSAPGLLLAQLILLLLIELAARLSVK